MMGPNDNTIASVTFTMDEPTVLTQEDLYRWVVWQFPWVRDDGTLCGAVHPPLPDFGWIPAVIDMESDRVTVFAHLEERYETPEDAAEAVA